MPDFNGRKATAFVPDSIAGGKVAGQAMTDDGVTRRFTAMIYDIAKNSYDDLNSGLSSSILLAEDGSVLSVNGRAPSIVSGKVTTDLPIGKGEYQVRNFSRDGRSAAGYSVFSVNNKTGNEPVRWRCR
jgi:hypothetical protein